MSAPRYVVVHGHFYQPPRENPWIEAIERQPSAQPYHDWNERIAWECYIPNRAARVSGKEGILDMVNNYAWIDLNFGPTLLEWFQEAFPSDYHALLEADRESLARLGHGNAIAQAYNHAILPLSSPRDLPTQVKWGIADFKKHFRRDPEGMWLPETAVNADSLRVLIDHGIRFTILAPGQAQKERPMGGGEWEDVSNGSINPRRAYRWFDRDAEGRPIPRRSIDLFFYDGDLAHGIAFESAIRNAPAFADRVMGRFDGADPGPQLVHWATDGESYGHHEKFAEMGLAYLVKYALPERGVSVINYATFLERHPPQHEVEIKGGPGTSWSCAHGVERWRADCGCGAVDGKHQRWRAPLREAFDALRAELDPLYEREAAGLLREPWAARDEYIDVILDRSETTVAGFMARHLSVPDEGRARVRALKLLEMQRYALLLYTSCAWFFEEISRIEPVQIMTYAARAMDLAKQLTGRDLEPVLLGRLEKAPSNFPEFGTGRGVYEKLVKPAAVTPDHLVGQYAIGHLFGEMPEDHSLYHYRIERKSLGQADIGGSRFFAGLAGLKSGVTGESWERRFLAVAFEDQILGAYVGPSDGGFEPLRRHIESLRVQDLARGVEAMAKPFFAGPPVTLENLLEDERERLFSLLVHKKIERLESAYESHLDEYLPLIEEMRRLALPIPAFLKGEVEVGLGHWLERQVGGLRATDGAEAAQRMRIVLERAAACGLRIQVDESEDAWSAAIAEKVQVLESSPTVQNAARVRALVELGGLAGFQRWRYRIENRVFQLLARSVFPRLAPGSKPAEKERPAMEALLDLGASLGIAVDKYRPPLAGDGALS